MKKIIVISLIIILFLAGCVDEREKKQQADTLVKNIFLDRNSIAPISIDCKDDIDSCKCFYCEAEGFLNWVQAYFSEVSLKDTTCYTTHDCSAELLKESIENIANNEQYSEGFVNKFIVGQGPSYGAFYTAQQYCSKSITAQVNWIVGSNGKYIFPLIRNSNCLLENGVFPVYVMYSKDGRIASNYVDIEEQLDDIDGPIFIITDMAISKHPTEENYRTIRSEIAGLDYNCEKCLIGLGISYGDDNTLEKLKDVLDKVDFIAVGIDNRDIINKEITLENSNLCTGAFLYNRVYNYLSHVSLTYKKPTFIPYILMDNKFRNEYCVWDSDKSAEFYRLMFYNSEGLARNGLLGFSSYSIVGNDGPIDCEDCSMVFNDDYQSQDFKSWFNYCNYFYSQPSDTPWAAYSFSEDHSSCDFATRGGFKRLKINPYSKVDDNAEQVQVDKICNVCVFYDDFPFDVAELEPNTDLCSESIDQAIMYNLDSDYIKALAYTISEFDNCYPANSQLCANTYVSNSYTSVTDPSGTCGAISTSLGGSPRTSCGYGLFGLKYLPYSYYDSQPSELSTCSNEFNPFDKEDNICFALHKFSTYISEATSLVSKSLDKQSSYYIDYFDNEDIYYGTIYLIATAKFLDYIGLETWKDGYFYDFIKSYKGQTVSCVSGTSSNADDFAVFLRDCKGLRLTVDTLSYYKWIINNCDSSDCKV